MHRSILLAVLAGAALADAPKPPSTEEALVADPADAKFAPVTVPGVPAGAQGAMIGVDPSTKGATTYAKLPAKYHFPMHWHSFAEYTALISGSATLPRTSATPSGRFAGVPVDKSSRTRTEAPRRTSASHRWDPINPHPPVTR